ncbi:hypothetical protein EZS27_023177 [termite gut metagenome]|uniref:Uncharacterized protein n=1 Tax=termite gut metagenome TaxID=433724 RepID=A0A5J4R5P6_9ZZZZ
MIVITPTELKTNQNKYFDLAEKERVAIRWGGKIIELVVNDEVSEHIEKTRQQIKEGKCVVCHTKEESKIFLESL